MINDKNFFFFVLLPTEKLIKTYIAEENDSKSSTHNNLKISQESKACPVYEKRIA